MFSARVLTIALVLTAGPAALAQLPPQPAPPKGAPSLGAGTDQERAACHPDVMKYCKQFLHDNGQDDVFGILGCLQSNRPKISNACQQVLASHGQ
jgi:hypothetical protein